MLVGGRQAAHIYTHRDTPDRPTGLVLPAAAGWAIHTIGKKATTRFMLGGLFPTAAELHK